MPDTIVNILNGIPAARRTHPAVANLIMDAIGLGDPVWAATLVRLIAEHDADPRAGTYCAAQCGERASTVCRWCPACAKAVA